MEVWVDLLILVLVTMNTELVVIFRLILPLLVWFDIEKLHELLDLNFGVLASETLASPEESILALCTLHLGLGWPFFFFVVIAIVFFSTLFTFFTFFSFFSFFAVVISIFVFFLLAIEVLVLRFRHSMMIDDQSFHGLIRSESSRSFQSFNRCKRISLWPRLLLER